MKIVRRASAAVAAAVLASSGLAYPASAETPSPAPPSENPAPVNPGVPIGGAQLGGTGLVWNATPGLKAPPRVDAKAYVIADAATGQVLAAKSPHVHYRPASTLKVLTSITLMPKLDLTMKVKPSQKAVNATGSAVGLSPKWRYSVSELFRGLMMNSGNDAAIALAEAYGGMPPTLAAMNAEARRLQANDTIAATPNGLDDAPVLSIHQQRSSAYDLALMMRAGLNVPAFRDIVGKATYKWPAPPTAKQRKRGKKVGGWPITTGNRMLRPGAEQYRGMIGGKTGYTERAWHTYTAAAERNGRTIIISLMRSPVSYWGDAADLLDWGFKAAGVVKPVGELVAPIPPKQPKKEETKVGPVTVPTKSNSPVVYIAAGAAAVVVVALIAVWLLRRRKKKRARTVPAVPAWGSAPAQPHQFGPPLAEKSLSPGAPAMFAHPAPGAYGDPDIASGAMTTLPTDVRVAGSPLPPPPERPHVPREPQRGQPGEQHEPEWASPEDPGEWEWGAPQGPRKREWVAPQDPGEPKRVASEEPREPERVASEEPREPERVASEEPREPEQATPEASPPVPASAGSQADGDDAGASDAGEESQAGEPDDKPRDGDTVVVRLPRIKKTVRRPPAVAHDVAGPEVVPDPIAGAVYDATVPRRATSPAPPDAESPPEKQPPEKQPAGKQPAEKQESGKQPAGEDSQTGTTSSEQSAEPARSSAEPAAEADPSVTVVDPVGQPAAEADPTETVVDHPVGRPAAEAEPSGKSAASAKPEPNSEQPNSEQSDSGHPDSAKPESAQTDSDGPDSTEPDSEEPGSAPAPEEADAKEPPKAGPARGPVSVPVMPTVGPPPPGAFASPSDGSADS